MPRRPVLLYDGDCAFCSSCARLIERQIRPSAAVATSQLADLDELGVTEEQAAEALQWVGADGVVRSGHEAVAAMLGTARRPWRLVGRLMLLPGISPLAAAIYRLVAANRRHLPGGTPTCGR